MASASARPPRPARQGPRAPAAGHTRKDPGPRVRPGHQSTALGTQQPRPAQPRPEPPSSHLCPAPGSSSSPRCASYQSHLLAPVIAPPCGQNPGLFEIADSSLTVEGGRLGSGILWISILASRPKVDAHCREPGAGQSVTLSPLTLPQSRDQAAGPLTHVVRRAGRGPLPWIRGGAPSSASVRARLPTPAGRGVASATA